jgi:hypothetical protein
MPAYKVETIERLHKLKETTPQNFDKLTFL